MIVCTKCGGSFEGKFCPECGTPAPMQAPPPSASAAKRFCAQCGSMVEGQFCANCGTPAPDVCPQCGLPAKGQFCTNCGATLPQSEAAAPPYAQPQAGQPYAGQPYAPPPIIINNINDNANTNTNTNVVQPMGPAVNAKNKWVAFFLCFFLGYAGAHKFYEGKILLGVIYLVTAGLCGVGWFIDCILLLLKPNPYYP